MKAKEYILARPIYWVLLALVVLVCTRVPWFSDHFYNVDTPARAVQALVCQQTGAVPEVDVWTSTKPPGLTWLYMVVFAVFGKHIWPLQLLALVLVGLSAIVVFALGHLLFDARAGAVAAALYVGMTALGFEPSEWLEAQTEYPETLLALLGALALVLLVKKNSLAWAFVAGLCFAGAIWFRQNALVFPVVLVPVACVFLWRKHRWKVAAALALGLAGFAVGCAPGVIYYYQHHALAALWLHVVTLPGDYAAKDSLVNSVIKAFWHFGAYSYYMSVPALLAGWYFLQLLKQAGKAGFAGAFTSALVGAGMLATAIGSRYFGHYFLQFAPALALAAGAGAVGLGELELDEAFRRKLLALAGVASLFFLVSSCLVVTLPLAHSSALRREQKAARQLAEPPEDLALAKLIKAHTDPKDTLAVVGLHAAIYWHADRLPGVRDVWGNLLTGYFYQSAKRSLFAPFEAAYAHDLRHNQPVAVIATQGLAKLYPKVALVLDEYYRPVTYNPDLTVWWLRSRFSVPPRFPLNLK